MYTEYNSQNTGNYYQPNDDELNEKPNRILSILWKVFLVILLLIFLFFGLVHFGVISLKSSVAPEVILLNQNEIGIKKGGDYQLITTVLPENASNKQVAFSSSDDSIVKVNATTGYLQGIKVGTAVVTVKTLINDKSTECIVNVTDNNILIDRLTINQKQVSLAVGYTHTITYRNTPANATELNLHFVSSNSNVATVDSKGTIKGISPGNAVITVTAGNSSINDTVYVTVYKKGSATVVKGESVKTNNYPTSIKLENTSLNLKVGTTKQLDATVEPANSNQKISWTSSNPNVATVDANGLITARGEGTADIIAQTINNMTAICKVTVGSYSVKLKSVLITTSYTVLPIGLERHLFVVFTPKNASDQSVTWSSSNPNVVRVDQNGNIETKSPGTAVVTVKSHDGGHTSSATIEVTGFTNIVEETSLAFNNNVITIGIGQTNSLVPIVTPNNATFKAVSFRSENPQIATVDESGTVTGIKEGNTKIIATTRRNGVEASASITVKYINATGVTLNQTNVVMNQNDTFTLKATVLPSNASDRSVTFASSNPNVATVDNNGIIKAISRGTVTITVTPNGGGTPSTCLVTIN